MVKPMLRETVICKLCLEPVTNYICSDCLFGNVTAWLRQVGRDDLAASALNFHSKLRQVLHSDENSAPCSVCKKDKDDFACPCCYLYEAYLFFKNVNVNLARDFEKRFNFQLEHTYSELDLLQEQDRLFSRDFVPVMIIERKKNPDTNICENCEEGSDDIVEQNGMWLCETCRDFER